MGPGGRFTVRILAVCGVFYLGVLGGRRGWKEADLEGWRVSKADSQRE